MHVLRSCFGYVRGWLAACALAALCGQLAWAASPISDAFVKRFTPFGSSTKSVWTAPGNTIGQATAASGARTWTPTAGGGAKLTESGEVLLERIVQRAEGAATLERVVQVTLAAERVVDGAAILAAMRAALGGPVGVVSTAAIVGLPLLKEWIEKDNAENIRLGPVNLEKKAAAQDPISTGYEYRVTDQAGNTAWYPSRAEACAAVASLGYPIPNAPFAISNLRMQGNSCLARAVYAQDRPGMWTGGDLYDPNYSFNMQDRPSACPSGWYLTPQGCLQNPSAENWLPASLNDIAPYLYPRPMPPLLPQQLLDKGVTIQSTPGGITGPTVPIVSQPIIDVTPVPVPPNETGSTSRRGNPFGLAPNTPTETSTSTSSSPVQMPDGSTVQAPSTTRTTSNYDPAADKTTSTTEKTYDPLRQEKSTTTKTTLDYDPDKVTADSKTTTIINIINNTTNQVINTSTKETNTTPAPESKDQCELHPNSLGCMDPGEPPPSDPLNKQTKEFQFSPVSFSSPASCPPPVTFTLGMAGIAGTYTMPYDGVCEFVVLLKTLVIALGAFLAAWIIADEFRVA